MLHESVVIQNRKVFAWPMSGDWWIHDIM